MNEKGIGMKKEINIEKRWYEMDEEKSDDDKVKVDMEIMKLYIMLSMK
jgi:hypothetical protein